MLKRTANLNPMARNRAGKISGFIDAAVASLDLVTRAGTAMTSSITVVIAFAAFTALIIGASIAVVCGVIAALISGPWAALESLKYGVIAGLAVLSVGVPTAVAMGITTFVYPCDRAGWTFIGGLTAYISSIAVMSTLYHGTSEAMVVAGFFATLPGMGGILFGSFIGRNIENPSPWAAGLVRFLKNNSRNTAIRSLPASGRFALLVFEMAAIELPILLLYKLLALYL